MNRGSLYLSLSCPKRAIVADHPNSAAAGELRFWRPRRFASGYQLQGLERPPQNHLQADIQVHQEGVVQLQQRWQLLHPQHAVPQHADGLRGQGEELGPQRGPTAQLAADGRFVCRPRVGLPEPTGQRFGV